MERNVNREASPVRVNGGDDFDRDERARSVPGSREPSMPRETINGKWSVNQVEQILID